jgi:hypothetical protein
MTNEEFFLSKLVTVSMDKQYPGNTIFKDSNSYVVMYNIKEDFLQVHFSIWYVFVRVYKMKHEDVRIFIVDMFKKHLHWIPARPISTVFYHADEISHLNWPE